MITALLVAAGAVAAFVALGFAMARGEVDRPHRARPVPPRPTRPADPDVWVDPEPITVTAVWADPEGALS